MNNTDEEDRSQGQQIPEKSASSDTSVASLSLHKTAEKVCWTRKSDCFMFWRIGCIRFYFFNNSLTNVFWLWNLYFGTLYFFYWLIQVLTSILGMFLLLSNYFACVNYLQNQYNLVRRHPRCDAKPLRVDWISYESWNSKYRWLWRSNRSFCRTSSTYNPRVRHLLLKVVLHFNPEPL